MRDSFELLQMTMGGSPQDPQASQQSPLTCRSSLGKTWVEAASHNGLHRQEQQDDRTGMLLARGQVGSLISGVETAWT